MAITKVINDAVDLNQTSDYSGLRLPEGTTADRTESFTADYLIVAGGGGGGTAMGASTIGAGAGGGAGGLRTSYNNSTTTTNTLGFPSGKTAIATYMLDNNADDISGNYNGTETNITYNTGQYGGAAVFNGSSSFINTNYTLTTDTTFAFSWWMNLETPSGGNQYIINDGNGTVHDGTFGIYYNASSQLGVFTGINGGITGGLLTISGGLSGSWMHFAVSIDGTTATIYKNGSSQGTITVGSHTTAGILTLIIGRLGHYNGFYSNGKFDQIRIYDTVLSGGDVTNIYNNEVQVNSGGGTAAESSLTLVAGTSYDVTVGAGGVRGIYNTSVSAVGNNSVFHTITSDGGGAGGNYNATATVNGGSGGGAAYNGAPGNGTLAQGYGGGSNMQSGYGYGNGGGGGAAAIGGNATTTNSGSGGIGTINSILNSTNASASYIGQVSGSNVYYAGGGGGGVVSGYGTGPGGLGGGGAGGIGVANDGETALNNTGGGGGGAGKNAASLSPSADGGGGGAGVVILRYPTANVTSFTTSGTLITPSATDTVANTAYPVANEAYYKLDGNVNEATGTHTANAYNITYSNGGIYNQAAVFDGGAYIDSGYTAVSSTSASISFWVNIKAYTVYGGFVGDSTGQSAAGRFFIGQGNGTAGNLWVSIGNTSTNSAWYDETTVSLTPYGLNKWFHLVGTVNGTTVKIYINGSLVHTYTSSVSYAGAGTFPYYFGGWGNSYRLNGFMDQIRFYSTELSQAYVTDLYNEHYKTLYTEGSDTVLVFNRGTGTINFSGEDPIPPQGAIRTNTSESEDGSASVIEHYNGTEWKYFDAIKYCTTNTLNFPSGAGCIASYNLDNNVADIGNTYNGVNSNVTFTASGKFGAAAVFNGSSSKITISGSPFNLTAYSLSFWIYAADYNQSATSIINIGLDNTGGTWGGLAFGVNANKVFYYGGDSGFFTQTGTTNITNANWVHVAMIVNGTSVTGYVNGAQDSGLSKTLGSNIAYRGGSINTIGVRQGAFGSYGWWNGSIAVSYTHLTLPTTD